MDLYNVSEIHIKGTTVGGIGLNDNDLAVVENLKLPIKRYDFNALWNNMVLDDCYMTDDFNSRDIYYKFVMTDKVIKIESYSGNIDYMNKDEGGVITATKKYIAGGTTTFVMNPNSTFNGEVYDSVSRTVEICCIDGEIDTNIRVKFTDCNSSIPIDLSGIYFAEGSMVKGSPVRGYLFGSISFNEGEEILLASGSKLSNDLIKSGVRCTVSVWYEDYSKGEMVLMTYLSFKKYSSENVVIREFNETPRPKLLIPSQVKNIVSGDVKKVIYPSGCYIRGEFTKVVISEEVKVIDSIQIIKVVPDVVIDNFSKCTAKKIGSTLIINN